MRHMHLAVGLCPRPVLGGLEPFRMKAPDGHTEQGRDRAQLRRAAIEAELAAQRAELARLMAGAADERTRPNRALSQKAKAAAQDPEPAIRSKPRSRSRKAVLAAYKARRGIA